MSENDHWIKIKENSQKLLHSDPDAFLIMAAIMFECRENYKNKYLRKKLNFGQALITRNKEMSERRWRDAKERIEQQYKLATFKGTNKGTIATLLNTEFCDYNFSSKDEQKDEQKQKDEQGDEQNPEVKQQKRTNKRRAKDEQALGTFDRDESEDTSLISKRGDDSDDMKTPLKEFPSSLPSQSLSSPLLHKEKKRKGVSWRTEYSMDWEKNADKKQKEHGKWPIISEMVNRYQIPERDILLWMKKHSIEKIVSTIELMELRNPKWVIKLNKSCPDNVCYVVCSGVIPWIQRALSENWAQNEQNRIINHEKIPQLIHQNDMQHLFDFTQDYCRERETGNDFQYFLNPDMLYTIVQRRLQAMIENMAESLA